MKAYEQLSAQDCRKRWVAPPATGSEPVVNLRNAPPYGQKRNNSYLVNLLSRKGMQVSLHCGACVELSCTSHIGRGVAALAVV